ncbi:MAG: 5'-methylthioadenosine/adenosylhomocysteine nucleosidase [Treponema sp.]|nr:5'-methylthioadenosine/adenosylhomocysteine nucleosidase [Treponema sp.]
MAKRIGIIGAMSVEVEQLKAEMQDKKEEIQGGLRFIQGKLNGIDAVVVQSGVGKVNAALCAQRLILQFGVSHIINTGIAGAMASGLGVLDFVVSTEALYHDMDATGFGYKITQIPQMDVSVFPADKTMVKAAQDSFNRMEMAKNHKIVAGLIASGDQFISDKAKKEKIRSDCNPACVEMEGAAIAHACYLNKTPFVIIRCMSDMADDNGESTYDFNEKTAATLSATLVLEMIGEI